jgi:hypothetical protein
MGEVAERWRDTKNEEEIDGWMERWMDGLRAMIDAEIK